MKIHKLKLKIEFFDAVMNGIKSFEIRKNDRDYKVGDILELNEWNSEDETYTGRTIDVIIIYIVQGIYGLPDDVCVMSIILAE